MTGSIEDCVLWRRLDAPGHDVCRLSRWAAGYKLAGAATFLHEEGPALVRYQLICNTAYESVLGRVRGWVGGQRLKLVIDRDTAGRWRRNGEVVEGLEGCTDLDYGFTPATNWSQLRRLALEVGDARECPVAWLEVPDGRLELLPQRYERRNEDCYWYQAPSVGYAGLIETTVTGFARRYPELWDLEAEFAG
jgi:hypothetical protein